MKLDLEFKALNATFRHTLCLYEGTYDFATELLKYNFDKSDLDMILDN